MGRQKRQAKAELEFDQIYGRLCGYFKRITDRRGSGVEYPLDKLLSLAFAILAFKKVIKVIFTVNIDHGSLISTLRGRPFEEGDRGDQKGDPGDQISLLISPLAAGSQACRGAAISQ